MERTIINRDNTQTLEQQIALLTQRIARLEGIVGELSKPLTWQDLEEVEQFV